MNNPLHLIWTGFNNSTVTGTLVYLQFLIIDNAPAGDTIIDVSFGQLIATGSVPVPSVSATGVITVFAQNDDDDNNDDDDDETGTTTPPPTTPQATLPPPPPEPTLPYLELDLRDNWWQNWQQPNVPDNIRDAAGDNPIIYSEIPEGEESQRELMIIPFEISNAAGLLHESIIAYAIGEDGSTQLVIPSLFDANRGELRLLGYTGIAYTIDINRVRFNDVNFGQWYYPAIGFAAARELFAGIGDNQFAPQSHMTRAMFITVLSRLDNAQYEAGANWYSGAINWAQGEGIIPEAMNAGGFDPHSNITREEMAAIFANYLAIRDFEIPELEVGEFADISESNPWAAEAILQMRQYGIIHGQGDNLFNPRGLATRAEVSQIFTNLVRAIVGLN
jgi:hypothetical protein